MKYLFFFLLFLFPFGQLGRLPLGEGEIALQLNDLAVGVLVGGWAAWHFLAKKKFTLPPLSKPILIFSLIAFLSFLLNLPSWGKDLSGVLYLLRWVAYAGLYFLVFELASKKEILPEKVFKSLVLAGIVVAALGIFQYFFYPDLRNLYYLGWDPHYFRVFSTFFDPTFTGAILVLTLILMAGYFFQERLKGWERLWFWVAVGVAYAALALTYSRGSYLAFLASMGVVAYFKKSPKFFLVVLLIFSLTLIVLPRREDRIATNLGRWDTIIARITNWKQSFVIIKDHPLIGVGFNNYRFAQQKYGFLKEEEWPSHAGGGADSSLLFVWATTGIFGFLGFLWLGMKMGKLALRSWWGSKSIYGLALFSSLLALFFHSFFSNSLFYPWIMEWMWILVGLAPVNKVRPR